MSLSTIATEVAAQSGTALELARGEALEIIDPFGGQVADVAVFSQRDAAESLSAGRTLDYNEKIYITTGAFLYSNRSSPLLRIEDDTVGRHDYLLTPCSSRMFELLRGVYGHASCLSNLALHLARFRITEDMIGATFNAFMNVEIGSDGGISVSAPRSEAGDHVTLRAQMDVIVGLTACSSEMSNDGTCKPILYRIHRCGSEC